MFQTFKSFAVSESHSGQFFEIEHFIMSVRLNFKDLNINRASDQRNLRCEVVDINPAGSKITVMCTFFNCLQRTQT